MASQLLSLKEIRFAVVKPCSTPVFLSDNGDPWVLRQITYLGQRGTFTSFSERPRKVITVDVLFQLKQ